MKKKLPIILVIASLTIISGLAIYTKGFRTIGLTKVEIYNYIEPDEGACLAIGAGCGDCYGKVIDKECYVDRNQLTPSQLREMGLN